MPEIKEELEWLERMKESQRIQYDYFKHLTTLGSGSVLFTIAFWEKLFTASQVAAKVCGLISIFSFSFTIVFSLLALPNIGNIILYINGIQRAVIDKDEKSLSEMQRKIDKAFMIIRSLDTISMAAYCFGIISLLVYAAINIIN